MSNDNDKTIQLELTLNEANLILESLGQQPFKLVYELIHKIQRQAQQQLGGEQLESANPSAK